MMKYTPRVRRLIAPIRQAAAAAHPTATGTAIHADNAAGRFHHVSFGHTIGLGADGDVKAAKQ